MFHGGIALLVLALILYPYPQRIYDENDQENPIKHSNEHFAIAIEFLNAYDIMDVVENVMCLLCRMGGGILSRTGVFSSSLGIPYHFD